MACARCAACSTRRGYAMPDDTHMPELLSLYALGATDGDECARVEEHVASCAACRAELDALSHDAALLGQAHVEPPPATLRAVVLDAIDSIDDAHAAAPAVVPDASTVRSVRPRRRRFAMPALVAACMLLALGVAVQSVRVADLRSELDDASTRTTQIRGTGALDTASIEVTYAGDGQPRLQLADMPQPPRDRAWQAWSIRADGTMTSLGTIERNSHIAGLLVDENTAEVAITLEPAGGSVQPTSAPMARGAVRI